MHYEGTAFAMGNTLTMTDLRTREPVERNYEISPQDFQLLNQIYPGQKLQKSDNNTVLVLSSYWGEWKPAMLINSSGYQQELGCFESDPDKGSKQEFLIK